MDFPINDEVNEKVISGSDLERVLLEENLLSSEDIVKLLQTAEYNDASIRSFLSSDELYSLEDEEKHIKR